MYISRYIETTIKNVGSNAIDALLEQRISGGLFEDISENEWDQHYLVNLKAPVFLTQLLLPHLKNGGRVLNVSTGLAHKSMVAMSAYGISKGGLFMLKEYFKGSPKRK